MDFGSYQIVQSRIRISFDKFLFHFGIGFSNHVKNDCPREDHTVHNFHVRARQSREPIIAHVRRPLPHPSPLVFEWYLSTQCLLRQDQFSADQTREKLQEPRMASFMLQLPTTTTSRWRSFSASASSNGKSAIIALSRAAVCFCWDGLQTLVGRVCDWFEPVNWTGSVCFCWKCRFFSSGCVGISKGLLRVGVKALAQGKEGRW